MRKEGAGQGTIRVLGRVVEILSEVFLEPEADVKIRLKEVSRGAALDPELADLRTCLRGLFEGCGDPEAQAQDYVRLFILGGARPAVHLYESVHRKGRLMDPDCLAGLRSLLDRAEIRPRQDVAMPPDHLGLELEFLAFCLGNLASGGEAQDRWSGIARDLLARHLVPFAASLGPQMNVSEPGPYYGAAYEILVRSLEICQDMVGSDEVRR